MQDECPCLETILVFGLTGGLCTAFWVDIGPYPTILLNLAAFFDLLYGDTLNANGQLMSMLVSRMETPVFMADNLEKPTKFHPVVVGTQLSYRSTFFHYKDMVLLMTQIHYFQTKMRILLYERTANNAIAKDQFFMPREKAIRRICRVYQGSTANMISKMGILEHKTTQLLRDLYRNESPSITDDTESYVNGTINLVNMLLNDGVMFHTLRSALPKQHTLFADTTLLNLLVEGTYVFYLQPEKKLYLTGVQSAVSCRYMIAHIPPDQERKKKVEQEEEERQKRKLDKKARYKAKRDEQRQQQRQAEEEETRKRLAKEEDERRRRQAKEEEEEEKKRLAKKKEEEKKRLAKEEEETRKRLAKEEEETRKRLAKEEEERRRRQVAKEEEERRRRQAKEEEEKKRKRLAEEEEDRRLQEERQAYDLQHIKDVSVMISAQAAQIAYEDYVAEPHMWCTQEWCPCQTQFTIPYFEDLMIM